MCELFTMSCNAKDRATRSLPAFRSYSDSAPHGWGIAYFSGNTAIVKREARPAAGSRAFPGVVEDAQSNVIIAHLRYRTQGRQCGRNCHPFRQLFMDRDWVFAHNGMVEGIARHPRSEGETDSEQAFNFMLDRMADHMGGGRVRGIYPGAVHGLKMLFSRFGEGVTFNMLMSDGSVLYAFNHYPAKPLYLLRREKDYGGALLISTQRLEGDWRQALPHDRLLLAERGQVLVLSDPVI